MMNPIVYTKLWYNLVLCNTKYCFFYSTVKKTGRAESDGLTIKHKVKKRFFEIRRSRAPIPRNWQKMTKAPPEMSGKAFLIGEIWTAGKNRDA